MLGKKQSENQSISYNIQCPACKEHYTGKTDWCFVTKLDAHGSQHDQPVFQHLVKCQQYHKKLSMLKLPISNNNIPWSWVKLAQYECSNHYSKILDYNNNWFQLCILEPFYIKTLKQKNNDGLKASEGLPLFK